MTNNNTTNNGFLLVITGPPASGKDSIMKELLNDKSLGLTRIITYATRQIREGEIEGVDYHFVSEEYFHSIKKKGYLIEHVKTGTTWKGTPKEPFLNIIHQNHRCIWRNDPYRGAKTKSLFYKHFGKELGHQLYSKTVTIFINVSDKETLKKRWIQRKKMKISNNSRSDFKKIWKFLMN